jgi:plastocyanin
MNRKLALTSIILFAVIMGIASMTPAMAAKNKVDLCHFSAEETILVDTNGDGIGDTEEVIQEHWSIINISTNGKAVNAHERNHAQDNGDGTFTNDFVITDADADVQAVNQSACDALITPPPQEFNVSIPVGTGIPGCEATNECYIPADLTVNVGDTVIWTNNDVLAPHTVTSGTHSDPDTAGDIFDSMNLNYLVTFSYTFNEAGQFDYHCDYHPWMTGVVNVT